MEDVIKNLQTKDDDKGGETGETTWKGDGKKL